MKVVLSCGGLGTRLREHRVVASFASVRNGRSFHAVHTGDDGIVTQIGAMPDQQIRINGGYFDMRPDNFDHIREGEELAEQPFGRLIAERRLTAFRWDGFWQCMDTFKDKINFDRMEAQGDYRWMVWKNQAAAVPG